MKQATINDAPEFLNTNDKAMWCLGFNAAQERAAEKYDDVLLPFLSLMRKELHANSRKGDRPGWLAMSPDVLLLEVYWHTAKLSAAVKNNDGPGIMEHSADVANMAMMVLDRCDGIAWAAAAPSAPTPPEQPTDTRPRGDEQEAKVRLTMRISYERTGRCFWHLNCKAQRHAPPMKIERDDAAKEETLLRCTACGEAGWYPHGSVGEVCCEPEALVAAPPEQGMGQAGGEKE